MIELSNISIQSVKCKGKSFSKIDDVIMDAKILAKELNCVITFEFNGVMLKVDALDLIEDIRKVYFKELG